MDKSRDDDLISRRSRSTFMGSTTIDRLSKKRTFDHLSYFDSVNKKEYDKLNRILDAHRENVSK